MKVDRKKNVIQLGTGDTRKWENSGPVGDEFRRQVRDLAESMSRASGRAVEIYASQSAGGWMADQIRAEEAYDSI